MAVDMNRRDFMGRSLATAAAGMALQTAASNASAQDAANAPAAAAAPSGLPMGKIGDLQVSRVLLGGNLLTHYTHSRDLKYVYNLCAHYNTDEKIVETLKLAEQHGINTLSVHTVPRVQQLLKRYRNEMGGKMQWIICPTAPVEPDMAAYTKHVDEIVADGTDAVYLWGVTADKLLGEGKIDLLAKAVEAAKAHGVPSGVGAHDLRVVMECEKNGIPADFYIKTFHHHNYPSGPKAGEAVGAYNEIPAYWCKNPEETIEFMKGVEKPWIAFKIMAAGAIPPGDAIPYVFNNGADHTLLGMFDFEIAEDVKIAREAIAGAKRTRPWRS